MNEFSQSSVSVETKSQLGARAQKRKVEKAIGKKTRPIRINLAIREAEIIAKKGELKEAMKNEGDAKWQIGELLIELVDTCKCKLSDLAKEFTRSKPRLSQYYNTAKTFAREIRRDDMPFSHHEFAREACRRANREAQKFGLKDFALKPNEFLAVMKDEGLNDKTSATARAANVVREQYRKMVPIVRAVDSATHNMANEQLLDELAKQGTLAKLIHLDPPYATYRKLASGRLDVSTAAAIYRDGDNLIEQKAIETTCETIRRCSPVLAKGGAILVWQGTAYLRKPILEAIEESGLEVFVTCVWDKGQPQPSDMTDAYTTQTEYMHVLRRKGDDLLFHEHKRMSNVFRHKRLQFHASDVDEKHIWQKPLDMMEDLVLLHTFEGDLVLDLYGCSAQMSIAAEKHNRRFVYCESHPQNYALGTANIGDFRRRRDAAAAATPSESVMP